MAQKTRLFNSQLRRNPSMFSALKTGSQAAVTNNALTVITYDSVTEINTTGNFSTSTNTWTAPENGWLDTTAVISIDGGTNGDDTMVWGFYKNGTPAAVHWDNWRKFSTQAGVEYLTYCTGAFNVSAGDAITVRYYETSYAVNIYASRPLHWTGIFYPERL